MDLKVNAMLGVDRDSSLTVREIGVLPVDPDAREWGLNNAGSFPVFIACISTRPTAAPRPSARR